MNASVKLYKPKLYGPKPSVLETNVSYIGGVDEDSLCSVCRSPMERLIHFSRGAVGGAPLQVMACSNRSCWQKLFDEGDSYCVGGKGVVVSRWVQTDKTTPTPTPSEKHEHEAGDRWTEGESTRNEWANDADGVAMDTLEAQLAAFEASPSAPKEKQNPGQPSSQKKKTGAPISKGKDLVYSLHAISEPMSSTSRPAKSKVAGGATSCGDDKINAMLKRYLSEEEDADLVALIQGDQRHGGGTSLDNQAEEEEEMLSDDQLAFMEYTERIKRAPQQVARYGGTPLWSIAAEPPDVPCCPHCGKEQSKCLQLLPPLLQVLQLDTTDLRAEQEATKRGMEWGAIAVFHCEHGCCENDSPFVIVQQSTDQRQQQQLDRFMLPPGVIEDGAHFSDDSDNDE